MSYSIHLLSAQAPEVADKFYKLTGKALFLATEFESKCHYFWRLGTIVKHLQNNEDDMNFWGYIQTLENQKTLHKAVIEFIKLPHPISEAEITILLNAKAARNKIAHETATISPYTSTKTIYEAVEKLKQTAITLISGNALISNWLYEIEEKEPSPTYFKDTYPESVYRWLFSDFIELDDGFA